ncbi:YraN family protein [Aestuariimicrobium ganziense]|uniref:YraN family protein n=1 Tax=Aestuariimicrobium ganziense TaxID=2773677 RepID=UPI0019430B86|nr:YraN family protein [Aestuariimicrobium ganziense]
MTSKATRALGRWGEDAAAGHCERLGWTVLERNWRCRAGEIDLVAREPDGTVVFVEVKCRSGRGFGDPLESITIAKLTKLRELAARWLKEHQPGAPRIRLDAIGVLRGPGGVELTHVKGIAR